MTLEGLTFWCVVGAGAILAGWWLSIRPGSIARDVASPVSFLTLIIAVLICLLTLTGQDVKGFTSDAYALIFSR